MEEALKRLDKLTQEEAWMAAAQNLKVTHAVDGRVKGVADTVEAIDNKVAGIENQMASIHDQVADVNERVAVDDRVNVIDNNVMQVIAGA